MSEIALTDQVSVPPMPAADPELEAMLNAGVHWGHARTKNHPSMLPYIFGVRNTVSVLDLSRTKEKLAAALDFIRAAVRRGGTILFVGTQPAARRTILELRDRLRMPYFVERWIGGALTNFKVIAKRVEYLENLEREKESGVFEKYTKKEQRVREEEMTRMRRNFGGIRALKRLPDAIIVVDTIEDATAIREARQLGIPVVALVDTNANASLVNYPIPSNDSALSAVRYMLERISAAVEEARQQPNDTAEEAAAKP